MFGALISCTMPECALTSPCVSYREQYVHIIIRMASIADTSTRTVKVDQFDEKIRLT